MNTDQYFRRIVKLSIFAFILVILVCIPVLLVLESFPTPGKTNGAESLGGASMSEGSFMENDNSLPIDSTSGFVALGEYQLVRAQCTACHSSKLVLQNKATREGWQDMIRWMQRTQKLWDLGEAEPLILDYLSTYYAPDFEGRRVNLVVDEWYEIP